MKIKTLVVSIIVLAVLAAGAFLPQRPAPPPPADARLNQPMVDRAVVEKAATLRIADAGKVIELTRQADGSWKVPSYFDMAADFAKLSGFVGNLTEAKLQRLVTSNAERIARLEFKDTKVELIGFNLLDSKQSAIDYYSDSYTFGGTSGLSGRVFHPIESRNFRIVLITRY